MAAGKAAYLVASEGSSPSLSLLQPQWGISLICSTQRGAQGDKYFVVGAMLTSQPGKKQEWGVHQRPPTEGQAG